MRGIPTTTWGRLTMVALLGMAVAHLLTTLIVEGELSGLAIMFELVLAGLAALVTTGRWWTYALAAAISGLVFLLTFTGSIERLTDTSDPAFLSVVSFLALALLAVIAGIRSAIKAGRGAGRSEA